MDKPDTAKAWLRRATDEGITLFLQDGRLWISYTMGGRGSGCPISDPDLDANDLEPNRCPAIWPIAANDQ